MTDDSELAKKFPRRVVCWFSCGAPSAVAAKLVLAAQKRRKTASEVVVARTYIPSEHPDNERFERDCAKWFGQPVVNLRSRKYNDTWDVWEDRKWISGPKGAPCTGELKKAVRWDFEQSNDVQVFGFSIEESVRAKRFCRQNPDVRLWTPLIDAGLSKSDCKAMVERAGIKLPEMYALGFKNNNCIPCAKATSPAYWNRIRSHFPAEFERMSELSSRLGARMVRVAGERIFLAELDPAVGLGEEEPDIECSLLCAIAEDEMA